MHYLSFSSSSSSDSDCGGEDEPAVVNCAATATKKVYTCMYLIVVHAIYMWLHIHSMCNNSNTAIVASECGCYSNSL